MEDFPSKTRCHPIASAQVLPAPHQRWVPGRHGGICCAAPAEISREFQQRKLGENRNEKLVIEWCFHGSLTGFNQQQWWFIGSMEYDEFLHQKSCKT